MQVERQEKSGIHRRTSPSSHKVELLMITYPFEAGKVGTIARAGLIGSAWLILTRPIIMRLDVVESLSH